jgi:hypothetical protein
MPSFQEETTHVCTSIYVYCTYEKKAIYYRKLFAPQRHLTIPFEINHLLLNNQIIISMSNKTYSFALQFGTSSCVLFARG